MSGKRFGHEPDFHEWLDAGRAKSVEDAVENGPVVDGISGGVFGVNVGRAPFEGSGAVSGSEQIVRTNIDWLGA